MNTDKLRFSFVIPNKLAGMSWPDSVKPLSHAVAYLKNRDVQTIVNTTTGNYKDDFLLNDFKVIHEPMANMTAPTAKQMDNILEAYLRLKENEAMVVHCMHGLGRTGLVLACIYGKLNNTTADEAISFIREKRQGSIESNEQEQFVAQYLA